MFTNINNTNSGPSRGFQGRPQFSRPGGFAFRPRGPYTGPRQYKPFVKTENTYGFNRNEFIKAEVVMVIDPNGESLGEMKTADAILKAREDYDLDLIEVAPNSKPPVCRIMDWSKFKYEQSKKQNNSSKSVEMKGMWFSPVIGEGDLNHKVERVLEFLSKKHPVKIEVRVRGRIQREIVFARMREVLALLEGKIKLEGTPKFEGKNYSVIVYPLKLSDKKEKKDEKPSENAQI
ncbi:MAG: translation initiation factor IF-3 [bacterium]